MPYTPSEITNTSQKIKQIDLICSKTKFVQDKNKKKNYILIADSGAGHSSHSINRIIDDLNRKLYELNFHMDYDIKIVGDGCYNEVKNCQVFPHLDYNAFQQLMYNASLVICRPGFNIFSELSHMRRPAIFFYEAGNPEMIDLEYQLLVPALS